MKMTGYQVPREEASKKFTNIYSEQVYLQTFKFCFWKVSTFSNMSCLFLHFWIDR